VKRIKTCFIRLICDQCKTVFTVKESYTHRRFCSAKCARLHSRKAINLLFK